MCDRYDFSCLQHLDSAEVSHPVPLSAVSACDMKRPAAASASSGSKKGKVEEGSLNNQMSEWRDKGKGEKWAKMRAAGNIPDHIVAMYDRPPAGAPARAFRTQII